jgi:hypothetical protein
LIARCAFIANWCFRGTESAANLDDGVRNFFKLCAEAGSAKCAVADPDNKKDGKQLTDDFDAFLKKLPSDKDFIARNEFFQTLYFKKATAFQDFAKLLKEWYLDPDSVKAKDSKKKRDFQVKNWTKAKTDNAILGISCGDRVVKEQGSAENYEKWLAEYKKTTKYGYDLSSAGLFSCSVWKTDAAEKYTLPFSNIKTRNPILLVNTRFDPVTPLISAQNSAKAFVGAKVIKSTGVGVSLSGHVHVYSN